MKIQNIQPQESISLFVKNIMVFDEPDQKPETVLPFYADGYPGIMFQQTAGGLHVMPHQKKVPSFFLYGQTIHPTELVMAGSFQLIVFQLYPFVLKSFFDITASDVNDDCYDLLRLKNMDTSKTIHSLAANESTEERIGLISSFLYHIFQLKKDTLDFKIRQAIQLITDNKERVSITDLCQQLKITNPTKNRCRVCSILSFCH